MTDENSTERATRRTVLRSVGTGLAGSVALSGTGAAFDGESVGEALEGVFEAGGALVDDALDPESDALQEVMIVFEDTEAVVRLEELDAEFAIGFDTLPVGYAKLPGSLVETVADWEPVRYVSSNYELEFHNDNAREDTNADAVQAGAGLETPYTGENVHVAVIDSGIGGSHPDLQPNLEANYQYVGIPGIQDEPLWWQDVDDIDTDANGHGTHCAGSIGGTGSESGGEYAGMAPDVDLTMYSTSAGPAIAFTVAAYDDLIRRQREGDHDIQIVSNSYGSGQIGRPFLPEDPLNVATWHAHEEGILSVFAAGNDGPDTGTLNQYAKAPHVLGVGATDAEGAVADFSSRGRPQDGTYDTDNYDRAAAYENLAAFHDGVPADEIDGPLGIYRNGVAAKGDAVMSTLERFDLINVLQPDDERYYGPASGTSMSCPVTAGCAALVYDAAIERNGDAPAPMDVLATLEATADERRRESYTAEAVGAGYVDVHAAVERAEAGEFAAVDEIDVAPSAAER
ncbi:peptidase S8 and S53 subtilisin kexin sedolisin [Haloterrigena turkmenica DSM 5511]|uniref:Peptidase S8 and S53 subtilisin kexin sedolisin n=1 Tax=Haloterrigena turkmenica (strain ATCC 51198 / DSM 5511 / JCM 9101 / NCIMB 13204 / VKM B-1734 / 4k) TaxID=543526 RepID=D2RXE3_HALTV|nr:S8 family serine peptidase [Haloterrigena turkmenica]ADB61667.1 peptidase S8 and S53 subtilisin kexin sedolisin [Haloterrigena turkmenica DSM 5511]